MLTEKRVLNVLNYLVNNTQIIERIEITDGRELRYGGNRNLQGSINIELYSKYTLINDTTRLSIKFFKEVPKDNSSIPYNAIEIEYLKYKSIFTKFYTGIFFKGKGITNPSCEELLSQNIMVAIEDIIGDSLPQIFYDIVY